MRKHSFTTPLGIVVSCHKFMRLLNDGFIELVDYLGNDYSILRAARTSTGNEAVKGDKKDRELIRYLYRNEHMSPFEFVTFHFHVKMPIFVGRQFFRHRAFSFNEISARYKDFKFECFYPEVWREQSSKNKQSSDGVVESQQCFNDYINSIYEKSNTMYRSLIGKNVAREQARTVMPVGQYTEFFFRADLRNLLHFLELRLDTHAQYEIRVYAEAILETLEHLESLKWSVEVFKDVYKLKQAFKESMDTAFKENTIEDLEDYMRSY